MPQRIGKATRQQTRSEGKRQRQAAQRRSAHGTRQAQQARQARDCYSWRTDTGATLFSSNRTALDHTRALVAAGRAQHHCPIQAPEDILRVPWQPDASTSSPPHFPDPCPPGGDMLLRNSSVPSRGHLGFCPGRGLEPLPTWVFAAAFFLPVVVMLPSLAVFPRPEPRRALPAGRASRPVAGGTPGAQLRARLARGRDTLPVFDASSAGDVARLEALADAICPLTLSAPASDARVIVRTTVERSNAFHVFDLDSLLRYAEHEATREAPRAVQNPVNRLAFTPDDVYRDWTQPAVDDPPAP